MDATPDDRFPAMTDTRWAQLLSRIHHWARQQQRRDGGRLERDVYVDAALTALAGTPERPGLLERYDPARHTRFSTYAERRLRGAIQDAQAQWSAWHQARPARTWGRVSADVLRPRRWTPETLCIGMASRALATLPAAQQRWCVARVLGATQRDHAAQEGVTEAALCARIKTWRTQAAQKERICP